MKVFIIQAMDRAIDIISSLFFLPPSCRGLDPEDVDAQSGKVWFVDMGFIEHLIQINNYVQSDCGSSGWFWTTDSIPNNVFLNYKSNLNVDIILSH